MHQIKLLDKSSKTEVNQCLNLLKQSFKGSLEYFYWKHNLEGIYNIEEYTFCVFQDNLCIATLQIIINTILYPDAQYRFAILSDGATHRDYRRLGLFEKLLDHSNEFCKERNISFIYGTGNSKSRKAFYKLGFEDFFTTLKASKKVRYNHPAMKIYNVFFNLFGWFLSKKPDSINEITIKDYALFSKAQSANHSISFQKTEAYLKWRLAEPTGNYKAYGIFNAYDILSGVVVVKKSKDLLYIVDGIYDDNIAFLDKLIQFVSYLAILDKNITRINSIHNNFKNIKSVFLKNKFKINKEGSNALLYRINKDFKVSDFQLNSMHYMRIDKNE